LPSLSEAAHNHPQEPTHPPSFSEARPQTSANQSTYPKMKPTLQDQALQPYWPH
jgi:hypothetical protein